MAYSAAAAAARHQRHPYPGPPVTHHAMYDPRNGVLVPSPRRSHTHAIAAYPFDASNVFGRGFIYLPEHCIGNFPREQREQLHAGQAVVVREMAKLRERENEAKVRARFVECEIVDAQSGRRDYAMREFWRETLGWAGVEVEALRTQRVKYIAKFEIRSSLMPGFKTKLVWNHCLGAWKRDRPDIEMEKQRVFFAEESERIDEERYAVEAAWRAAHPGRPDIPAEPEAESARRRSELHQEETTDRVAARSVTKKPSGRKALAKKMSSARLAPPEHQTSEKTTALPSKSTRPSKRKFTPLTMADEEGREVPDEQQQKYSKRVKVLVKAHVTRTASAAVHAEPKILSVDSSAAASPPAEAFPTTTTNDVTNKNTNTTPQTTRTTMTKTLLDEYPVLAGLVTDEIEAWEQFWTLTAANAALQTHLREFFDSSTSRAQCERMVARLVANLASLVTTSAGQAAGEKRYVWADDAEEEEEEEEIGHVRAGGGEPHERLAGEPVAAAAAAAPVREVEERAEKREEKGKGKQGMKRPGEELEGPAPKVRKGALAQEESEVVVARRSLRVRKLSHKRSGGLRER